MAATRTSAPAPFEDEELALYWEPRYHSYFYAGAMTPPTRQLYDADGRPITRPTDTHTWTVVRLEPTVIPLPRRGAPPPRPVIVRVDGRDPQKRSSKGRRISWNFLDTPVNQARAPERMTVVAKKRPLYRALWGGVFYAVLFVLVVLIAMSFYIRILAEEQRRREVEEETATPDVNTQEDSVL